MLTGHRAGVETRLESAEVGFLSGAVTIRRLNLMAAAGLHKLILVAFVGPSQFAD
jgi:hypothetical protein